VRIPDRLREVPLSPILDPRRFDARKHGRTLVLGLARGCAMKVLVALAAVILSVSAPPTPSAASCPDAGSSCPLASGGWVLFVDSNRRVPDFWLEAALVVQEIDVCRHGISFLFEGRDEGNNYQAALVFVNPSGDAWSEEPDEVSSLQDRSEFQERYDSLLEELRGVAGGIPAGGGRIDFRSLPPGDRPRILSPMWRLALQWKGREIPLRGYLDVFLNSLT
jgi:hypothetical protein